MLQAADRPIAFQHVQDDLIYAADSVFAKCAVQLVHADTLLRHVRFDNLAIVYRQRRLALDRLAETAIQPGKVGQHVIQRQQRVHALTAPPISDASAPVIAFCTELESRSSSVRSNGVICPTSRLSLKHTPYSTSSR